jgi:hypothetical protein
VILEASVRLIYDVYNTGVTFLNFSLIIEGATEKVLQFIMPLGSIYDQNIGFIEQILYF